MFVYVCARVRVRVRVHVRVRVRAHALVCVRAWVVFVIGWGWVSGCMRLRFACALVPVLDSFGVLLPSLERWH